MYDPNHDYGVPVVGTTRPCSDVNGYVYAHDSFTIAPFKDEFEITVIDEEPDDGDDSPEGFAVIYLTREQIEHIRDGLNRLLDGER